MRWSSALPAALAVVALAPAAAHALVAPLDQSTRLNIRGSAASVLVGNPLIADVTVVDSHTLYVMGRAYGATNLVVLDRMGHPLYSGQVVVEAQGSNVSLYRGRERADYACTPRCAASANPAPDSPEAKFAGALQEMVSARMGAAPGAAPSPPQALPASTGGPPAS